MEGTDYITVPEAAAMLGVTRNTMRTIMDRKLIPYSRPSGGHFRLLRSDVIRYRDQVTVRPSPIRALDVEEDLLAAG